MTRIECPGLDGSNPLHFLASMGILRTLPRGARMGWTYRQGWNPWYETEVQDVSKWISQAIRRGVKDHAPVRSPQKRNGSLGKVVCDPDDRAKVQEAWAFLGFSDIPKVKPSVFRGTALSVLASIEKCLDSSHPAWTLSALNAENVPDKDGLLEPTPFSFSNGGGMQFFLKDFLSLVSLLSPEDVSELLDGGEARFVWFTSLNWDPTAQRSYAMQWGDPESSPKLTDVAANVLAFVGLACLPVVPTASGNIPLCYDPKEKSFRWPIWEHGMPLDVLGGLLASFRELEDVSRVLGGGAIFESTRFSSNKRLYFAPSRSL